MYIHYDDAGRIYPTYMHVGRISHMVIQCQLHVSLYMIVYIRTFIHVYICTCITQNGANHNLGQHPANLRSQGPV